MRTKIVVLAFAMTVVLTVVTASAHHSDVAYDPQKQFQLKNATIVSYAWRNPHGVMVCDVKGDAGAVERWTLETGSPSSMMSEGWNKNSVLAGDVVTIDVNPARNGTKFGRVRKVAKADGTVLTVGTSERNRTNR